MEEPAALILTVNSASKAFTPDDIHPHFISSSSHLMSSSATVYVPRPEMMSAVVTSPWACMYSSSSSSAVTSCGRDEWGDTRGERGGGMEPHVHAQ